MFSVQISNKCQQNSIIHIFKPNNANKLINNKKINVNLIAQERGFSMLKTSYGNRSI